MRLTHVSLDRRSFAASTRDIPLCGPGGLGRSGQRISACPSQYSPDWDPQGSRETGCPRASCSAAFYTSHKPFHDIFLFTSQQVKCTTLQRTEIIYWIGLLEHNTQVLVFRTVRSSVALVQGTQTMRQLRKGVFLQLGRSEQWQSPQLSMCQLPLQVGHQLPRPRPTLQRCTHGHYTQGELPLQARTLYHHLTLQEPLRGQNVGRR